MSAVTMVAAAAVLVAALWFAVLSVVLFVSDVRHHRLPNRVLVPALVGVPALLVLALALGDSEPAVGRVVAVLGGGAACFTVMLVLAIAGRGALGGGDVKLATLCGAVLGAAGGWEAIGWGALLAAVFAGVLATISLKRDGAAASFALAPTLLIATWVVAILSLVWRE